MGAAGAGLFLLSLVACKQGSESTSSPFAATASAEAPSSSFAWVAVKAGREAAPDEQPAKLLRTSESDAVVVAPLPARIVALAVKPGDAVNRGDVVAQVIMPELDSATAAVTAAESSLAVLEKRRERLAGLVAEGLVREAEVAALDLDIAKHRAERVRGKAVIQAASGATGGTVSLRSPLAGIVVELGATLGEQRRPEDGPIVRVRSRVGQRVEATLPHRPPADAPYSLRTLEGDLSLTLVNHAPAPSGVGYLAWFAAGADVELPSASEGRLRIGTPTGDDVWAVPASAVGVDGTKRFVVARPSPTAPEKAIAVELLRVANAEAVVRGELAPGMLVATAPERAAEALRGPSAP